MFDALMSGGRVKCAGQGQPKQHPQRVGGDKAYSPQAIRTALWRRKIGMVIPHPRNQRRRGPFDQERYQQRNQVDHFFSDLIEAIGVIELYPLVWLLLSSINAPDEFSLRPTYSLPQGFY